MSLLHTLLFIHISVVIRINWYYIIPPEKTESRAGGNILRQKIRIALPLSQAIRSSPK
jgi:hypothetical protein